MPLLERWLGDWGSALAVTLAAFALLAVFVWLDPEPLRRRR